MLTRIAQLSGRKAQWHKVSWNCDSKSPFPEWIGFLVTSVTVHCSKYSFNSQPELDYYSPYLLNEKTEIEKWIWSKSHSKELVEPDPDPGWLQHQGIGTWLFCHIPAQKAAAEPFKDIHCTGLVVPGLSLVALQLISCPCSVVTARAPEGALPVTKTWALYVSIPILDSSAYIYENSSFLNSPQQISPPPRS